MTKKDMLQQFVGVLEWEGGWEGLCRHGVVDSGDGKLDSLIEELDGLLAALDERLDELHQEYDLDTGDEDEG